MIPSQNLPFDCHCESAAFGGGRGNPFIYNTFERLLRRPAFGGTPLNDTFETDEKWEGE